MAEANEMHPARIGTLTEEDVKTLRDVGFSHITGLIDALKLATGDGLDLQVVRMGGETTIHIPELQIRYSNSSVQLSWVEQK